MNASSYLMSNASLPTCWDVRAYTFPLASYNVLPAAVGSVCPTFRGNTVRLASCTCFDFSVRLRCLTYVFTRCCLERIAAKSLLPVLCCQKTRTTYTSDSTYATWQHKLSRHIKPGRRGDVLGTRKTDDPQCCRVKA